MLGCPEQLYPYLISPGEMHPSVSSVLLSSHYSDPTIKPSPYFGEQMSFEVSLPPEQINVGSTDIQSEEQPLPSNLSPSSHNSG